MKLIDFFIPQIDKYIFYLWILTRKISLKKKYYFICSYGIGDTLMVCLLLKEFRVRNPGHEICLIIKSNHVGIVKMFSSFDQIKEFKNLPPFFETSDSINLNRPMVLHPSSYFSGNLVDYLGYRGITLIDVYKIIMCLPSRVKFDFPKINSMARRKSIEKFNSYCLRKGKTVILAPEAKSSDMLEGVFWDNLSKELNDKGFDVACLTLNKKNHVKGTTDVEFNLEESIPFCEEAGYLISVRSGLCDLLSFSSARLFVVYPDVKWHGGSLFDATSIVSMGFNKNVEEYIYGNRTVVQLINSIN